ncbi:diacylglycerol kinase [Campylobacter sp. FMV-PI01]|uniref:Diacylglycerol kinase n=1 Tax=Campylobacter portucalensis TaxID=2608384 RepID=A0A6L5WIN2_9BACT|nr:diacylglycerol kinase [Campylobacter portucalensis]MSN97090.1 diacylglycerol kinase [Campylobacter portucalensis]
MKPKYSFFKNANYALQGLKQAVKNEMSFKIELVCVCVLSIILIFLEISILEKLIMFIVLILILISELINTAIENVVDLITSDYQILAKIAKDIASAIVFLSINLAIIVWCVILFYNFKQYF